LLVRTRIQSNARPEQAWGVAPPDPVVVAEHGMKLCASLWHGQKTGLFLDHRESRRRVRELARDLRVLNLYGYTGGFSVAAGLGGASHVTTVDSAKRAVDLADANWIANGLDPTRHACIAADVPEQLAELAEKRRRFDLIVADPPSFAPSEVAKPAALESYAALHAASLRVLEPGGFYLAASCSSHVTAEDFAQSLREGGRRARRAQQVLERNGGPADHPRLLGFPEGDYLKVFLLRAD
jgi:23S rRNA (cytosine1962-C5)-methyltransferase